MTTKLAHCLNKTILVSIPALFGDDQPRPCKLIDIEPSGLWLEAEDFAERIRLADKRPPWFTTATAFFPFPQIAYLLDTTQFVSLAQSAAAANVQDSPREGTRERPGGERHGRRAEIRPPHKHSKPRR